ncbi:MAG: hypothetical protein J0H17_16660 [Rhizobiales bacterium]|nr:hypothetical protein [Hyphomicrobiales bacterium]
MRCWLTALFFGICFWANTSGAQAPKPASAATFSTTLRDDCDEECHSWPVADEVRAVMADVPMPSLGSTLRVRYSADWIQGQPCSDGRLEAARRIVGTRHSAAFLTRLFGQGFCPRVQFNGTPENAPYLASHEWNDVVFDAERARLLTRQQYGQWVVPAIRRNLASQEANRWTVLSLFSSGAGRNADLLAVEISAVLADPNPSHQQETRDGQSDKATNVVRVADAATGNGDLVDTLLNQLDADSSLSTHLGYRRLITNLAGISSSVPTWGSPPVCANVDRIAKHLPWGLDSSQDATFLASLSRCDKGSENLLRLSLSDPRPVVVATGIRVWWSAAASGRAVAQNLAPDVVTLVLRDAIPIVESLPVYAFQGSAQRLIDKGSAIEDTALGLSSLGLLSETIDRLGALGRSDQVRALRQGLEQGNQRRAR